MQLREPLPEQVPHGYKKVVILVGVLLLVIIAGILVWYLVKNKPKAQQPLTESQKQVIIMQLNTASQAAPLTNRDRYQMITGRPYSMEPGVATTTATATTTVKKKASK